VSRIQVQMPDGTIIDAPEGTTKAQIMAKYQPQEAPPAAPQQSAPVTAEMRAAPDGPHVGMNEDGSPDLPEFQAQYATLGQQFQLAAGFLLNADPDARKDMLRNVLGDGVQFEEDANGRTIVVFGDERAYLNKPGFSMRDATQLAFDIAKFAPAAKLATWAGRAPMALGKAFSSMRAAITGGAGAAATQAASDVASGAFGSEQGVDPVGVGLAAAGGAGGELIAGRFRTWAPQARELVGKADDMNINLRGQPGQQVQQAQGAVTDMVPVERGAAMPGVAAGVRTAREAEATRIGALFNTARQTRAAIPQAEVQSFSQTVRRELTEAGFDLGDDTMKAIARRVDELDRVANLEGAAATRLQALQLWRKRVSQMTPKDGSAAQTAGGRMKNMFDNWANDMFNKDMVQGDPNAINAWRTAISEWSEFKHVFDANRTVRNLARQEATPEQMSQWLFNANAVGSKANAGLVVNRLNQILGPDSAQMHALRKEVLLDISEPLLRDAPDIRAFVRNYEKFFFRNPTLKKELFPDGMGEFDDLMKIARGIAARPGAVPPTEGPDMLQRVTTLISRYTVGHGIARAGVRVRVTSGAAGWLLERTTGVAARRNILREALGMDPRIPMFEGATAIGAAGMMLDDE
jgi:hypothetical protein